MPLRYRRRDVVVDSDDDDDDSFGAEFGSALQHSQFLRPSKSLLKTAKTAHTNLAKKASLDHELYPDTATVQTPSRMLIRASIKAPKTVGTVRVRKLGRIDDDVTLLRPPIATTNSAIGLPFEDSSPRPRRKSSRPRITLRTRQTRRVSNMSELSDINNTLNDHDEAGEVSTEEVSVLEDVDVGDGKDERREEKEGTEARDTQEEADYETEGDRRSDEGSEFRDSLVSSGDDERLFFSTDDDDVFSWNPAKQMKLPPATRRPPRQQTSKPVAITLPGDPSDGDEDSSVFFSASETIPSDLKKPHLQSGLPPTKTKAASGLVSPSEKMPRIPQTPHRPSTDAFWDQLVVDNWNTEHSPRKLLFGNTGRKSGLKAGEDVPGKDVGCSTAGTKNTKTPDRRSPKKKALGDPDDQGPRPLQTAKQLREEKKRFQQDKQARAEQFLAELDHSVTDGALARLAAGTGGVRIVWTNKLQTTAGRANWRRETFRSQAKSASVRGNCSEAARAEIPPARVLHHASIELADKVIDNEHRLLNVLAHEFCHLACFMISGVTSQPHGPAFRGWAAKCVCQFGASHGITVTTKHTYEIDFKYVWTCEDPGCGMQFQRHSKSINPAKHRCGACHGQLLQTKPVPRRVNTASAADKKAGGLTGPSEYQRFMKEHMAAVREANLGSPQKEIMRLVANQWAEAKAQRKAVAEQTKARDIADLDKAFVDLALV